jgi:hypothetical protein
MSMLPATIQKDLLPAFATPGLLATGEHALTLMSALYQIHAIVMRRAAIEWVLILAIAILDSRATDSRVTRQLVLLILVMPVLIVPIRQRLT